jgi:hypothetical protein
VLVIVSIARVLDPTLPNELLQAAGAYIVARAGQKAATSFAKAKENAAVTNAQADIATR